MKKIIVVVQARLGSTRLPGKVLKEVEGKPLLWYLFERLRALKHEVTLLLATSDALINKPLEKFAKENDILIYRGSENDVLDRFYQASKEFKADIIVRITGDCPLIDPKVIDRGLDLYLHNKYHYISNGHPPTYPDGYDTEIFSFEVLENMWKNALKNSEREHVTPFIYNNPEIFKRFNIEYKEDWSKYRLTVDEPEDFVVISEILKHFKKDWPIASMEDIIEYLNNNEHLLNANENIKRNEGYEKSLNIDFKI
ncbi:acylneuraminate cytidylyltransferase [Promethearchaeum syntrophicum]|uniref:Acylneuraminate cytidylyltransferase n=1 Tax=Promethearchaeum syntrophicum TaxID=2594042 RepID=A0A5B9D9Y1_9ARCH|nr:glycosyltransferase family protein [Candidatus Prometheoarchaeum syntrophicum]QEE16029.1 3-deoxy-manno-octulosonate cytidylyltransferase [Candidatus Prometheoarchaeum syntrophicum]